MVIVPKTFFAGPLILLVTLTCFSSAVAAKTAAVQKAVSHHISTDDELIDALRGAKVVDGSYGLQVKQTKDEVIVSTQRDPKFSVSDTKAQGVLIAKSVFDLVPAALMRVKVMYQDSKDGGTYAVLINRTEIESYGKGLINDTKLLASLELEKQGDSSAPGSFGADKTNSTNVVDGPLKAERARQFESIEFLKSRGSNVSMLENLFAEQEKKAAAGDEKALAASVHILWDDIKSQREAFQSAQDTAHGKNLIPDRSSRQASQPTRDDGSNKYLQVALHSRQALDFLKSKGVNVTQEEQMFGDIAAHFKDKSFDHKRHREELTMSIANKLSRLSPADQQEFFQTPHSSSKAKWSVPQDQNFRQNRKKQF